jgi:putative inorganic carbon (HCO3(-)) transporter
LGFLGAKQGWFHLLFAPGSKNINGIPFLGEENGMAIGMLMLVPVFLVLSQTSQNKWLKSLYWFLVIGSLYLSLSTYSRGAFLGLIALCLFYWLRSHRKFFLLCQLAIIIGLLFATLPDNFWARMDTISTYEEVGEESAMSRLHFWNVALKMAAVNPWLGVGYNAFNPSYNYYDFSHGKYGRNRAPHSSWYGVLADLGYAGAIIYETIILCCLWNCQWIVKQSTKNPGLNEIASYAKSIQTSLLVWIAAGSFHTFQYNEMVWHFLALTIVLSRLASEFSNNEVRIGLPIRLVEAN